MQERSVFNCLSWPFKIPTFILHDPVVDTTILVLLITGREYTLHIKITLTAACASRQIPNKNVQQIGLQQYSK